MPYLRFKLSNPRRIIEVENDAECSRITFDADLEPLHETGTFKIIAPQATLDGFQIKGTAYLQSAAYIKDKGSTLWCICHNDRDGGNCHAWYEIWVYLSNDSTDRLMQVDLDKSNIRLDLETPLPSKSATDIPLIYGEEPDGKELEWHVPKGNHTTIVKHSFQITPRIYRHHDIEDQSGERSRLVKLLDDVIASLGNPDQTQKLSQLILEINDEWENADTEEKRVSLLDLFDLAHRAVLPALKDPDLKERIEESQSKIYKTFIVSECLIGENVSIDRLDRVTKREIAANRMTKDHTLRNIADQGLAAPYLSEDELLEMVAVKGNVATTVQPQNPVATILEATSFVKKIRSALRLFGI